MTHDLYFNRNKGKWVNQCVQESEVPEVIFGHLFLRYLHLLHHLQWTHPNTVILCNNADIEKSYWRLHTKVSVSTKCIAIYFLDKMWTSHYQKSDDEVAILLTRLLFVSAPAPGEFCITSETVLDLSNYMIQCKYWDSLVLHYPYIQRLPKTLRL